MAELKNASDCDEVASYGKRELMDPSSWLRFARAADSFREHNEARDYAAEYRVRATRARAIAARMRRMRVHRPSALA